MEVFSYLFAIWQAAYSLGFPSLVSGVRDVEVGAASARDVIRFRIPSPTQDQAIGRPHDAQVLFHWTGELCVCDDD